VPLHVRHILYSLLIICVRCSNEYLLLRHNQRPFTSAYIDLLNHFMPKKTAIMSTTCHTSAGIGKCSCFIRACILYWNKHKNTLMFYSRCSNAEMDCTSANSASFIHSNSCNVGICIRLHLRWICTTVVDNNINDVITPKCVRGEWRHTYVLATNTM